MRTKKKCSERKPVWITIHVAGGCLLGVTTDTPAELYFFDEDNIEEGSCMQGFREYGIKYFRHAVEQLSEKDFDARLHYVNERLKGIAKE